MKHWLKEIRGWKVYHGQLYNMTLGIHQPTDRKFCINRDNRRFEIKETTLMSHSKKPQGWFGLLLCRCTIPSLILLSEGVYRDWESIRRCWGNVHIQLFLY